MALAIAAATALIPATASAAARSTAPAACSHRSLRAADHFGLVPTARRAGQKIDVSTPVCQPNGQWYQGTSEFEESYQ